MTERQTKILDHTPNRPRSQRGASVTSLSDHKARKAAQVEPVPLRPAAPLQAPPQPLDFRRPVSRREALRWGGLAALVVGVGAVGLKAESDSRKRHVENVERDALAEVTRARNVVLELKPGTILRKAPALSGEADGPRVHDGEVVRVDKPLVYEERISRETTHTWYGFKLDLTNQEGSDYTWVNGTLLASERNTDDEHFMRIYDYTSVDPADAEGSGYMDVQRTENGTFYASEGRQPHTPIALGMTMSETAFGQVVTTDNLVPRAL